MFFKRRKILGRPAKGSPGASGGILPSAGFPGVAGRLRAGPQSRASIY
jgi:hypothetical protein